MRFWVRSNLLPAFLLRAFVFLLLQVTIVTVVGAQSVTTYSEAVEWLGENKNNPQFGSVLYTAVEYAPSVEAVGKLLDEYLEEVMDRSDQGRILLRAGIVRELSHQYNRARLSYARALKADPSLWEASLRRSALAIEEGDTAEAVLLLTQAIHQSPTREIQRRAAILRVRAFAIRNDTDRAFLHAASLVGYDGDSSDATTPDLRETVEPEALLLLYETAQLTGNVQAKEWSSAALSHSFAHGTPERSLAQDGESPDSVAMYYPSPSRIFGGFEIQSVPIVEHRKLEDSSADEELQPLHEANGDRKPAVTGIQTGSFRDRENAQYMAEDIRKLEFSAEVRVVEINDTQFYRVIVPLPVDATPESAQETVVRLKEEGIEGFLIFKSP